MAKDGTNRGGRRIRAGDKPEALADKIAKGKAATIIDLPTPTLEGAELNDGAELTGEDMPNPSDYLSARQRDGKPLGADDLFRQTWQWLKDRGCERLVNPRLLEAYAQAFARYIQCEEAISTYGLLGKHPTTGGADYQPVCADEPVISESRRTCSGMRFSISSSRTAPQPLWKSTGHHDGASAAGAERKITMELIKKNIQDLIPAVYNPRKIYSRVIRSTKS
jgi:hypothetical protein